MYPFLTKILQFFHNPESPLLVYNNGAEPASIITLAYLQTKDYYRIGYVDFIFNPYRKNDDVIIIELKMNHTEKRHGAGERGCMTD